jgi:hypothetical protein
MGDLVQAGGLADLSPYLVDANAINYEDILPYFRQGRHVGILAKWWGTSRLCGVAGLRPAHSPGRCSVCRLRVIR